MTGKRFLVKYLEYEAYYVDTEKEYVDTEDYLEIDEYPTMSDEQVVECLNKFFEENEQLKEELDYYKFKCASLEEGLIQKEREISMLKNTIDRTEAYIERLTHKSNWGNSAFDVSEERKTNKSIVSEIYQKENDEEIPNYNFKKINYRRKRII